jgi:hypothetical protein
LTLAVHAARLATFLALIDPAAPFSSPSQGDTMTTTLDLAFDLLPAAA